MLRPDPPQTPRPTARSTSSPGWLLEDFADRVVGVQAAVLASRDGLAMASAGLAGDRVDRVAAMMSGLYALSGGLSGLAGTGAGAGQKVRQMIVEHDETTLFVMSTPAPVNPAPGALGVVGSVLGVLARPDADPGIVGHEMAMLVRSVAEHLVTSVRDATSAPDR